MVVILRPGEPADALIEQVRSYHIPQPVTETPAASMPDELRTYGVGAQIIADLGVRFATVHCGANRAMLDAAGREPVCGLWRQQQVINPNAVVFLPGAGLIVPECKLTVGAER